jgi:hypothetical protein
MTTWDGSVIKHYADGRLIWADSSPSSGTSQRFTSIAGYAGRIFKGRIDEVRIYNAALTASAIRENYLTEVENLYDSGKITKEEYQQRMSKLDSTYAVNE